MNLSADLISQFVKITNDDKKNKTETIHYGTVKEKDGRFYVKLDGSELLTPIRTVASLHVDDRVTVMIKNHTAVITGNITTPSARTSDVEALNRTAAEIEKRISEFEENVNHIITKDEFEAEKAKIVALQEADKHIVNDIDNLQKTTGTHTTDIAGLKKDVVDLKESKLDATKADETYSTKEELNALEQRVSEFEGNADNVVNRSEFESEKAKIVALQEADTELQNGIDSVDERIDNLVSEIDGIKSTVNSQVSDIGTIKNDISGLKTSKLDSSTAANTYSTKNELSTEKEKIASLQEEVGKHATKDELTTAVNELRNLINNMEPSPEGGGNGSSGYIVSDTQPSDWATGVIWFDTTGTI